MHKQQRTKSGKGRRPLGLTLPLGIKKIHRTETTLRAAVMAIGTNYFNLEHVGYLYIHGEVIRRIAPLETAILGLEVLKAALSIKDRAERTGKVGATGDEARIIREGTAVTIPFYMEANNTTISKALKAIDDEARTISKRYEKQAQPLLQAGSQVQIH